MCTNLIVFNLVYFLIEQTTELDMNDFFFCK